ncbi:hypothetical protein ACOKM5_43920 [Streptomyces sp. BH097]|uniref:hypothetical protein n=1 Tax=unclassified Streptomyces TaxID=2593676 RepID=UPI003BB7AA77
MIKKNPVRFALTAAIAGVLATGAASSAQATIPPAPKAFQIKTVFEGKMMCVSSHKTDAVNWGLVDCDRDDTGQHFKRASNHRGIQNVSTGKCIAENPGMDAVCRAGKEVGTPWKQDRYGRVFKQGDNSITRLYFHVFRHNSQGPVLGFKGTTNDVTPEETGYFAFDAV